MNAKGTQNNPYSVSEYQDLLENNLWEGGWVVIDAKNIYITKKGNQEKDLGSLRLGSVNNPFSEDAYTEMHSKEQWPGGYVLFIGDTEPTYMRSSEEELAASCGCGCGCGSGSMSGCGSGSCSCILIPGSEVIGLPGRRDGKDGHYKVEISWEADREVNAKIIGFYTSSMGVEDYDGGAISGVTLECYMVIIPFNGFEYRFEIPEIYHFKE